MGYKYKIINIKLDNTNCNVLLRLHVAVKVRISYVKHHTLQMWLQKNHVHKVINSKDYFAEKDKCYTLQKRF